MNGHDLDEAYQLAKEIRGVGLRSGAQLVEKLVERIVFLEDSLETMADKAAKAQASLQAASETDAQQIVADAVANLLVQTAHKERDKLALALKNLAEGEYPRPRGKIFRADGQHSKSDECIHNLPIFASCDACMSEYAKTQLEKTGL